MAAAPLTSVPLQGLTFVPYEPSYGAKVTKGNAKSRRTRIRSNRNRFRIAVSITSPSQNSCPQPQRQELQLEEASHRPVSRLACATPALLPAPVWAPPSKGVRLAGVAGLLFVPPPRTCMDMPGNRRPSGLATGLRPDAVRNPVLILGTLGAILNLGLVFVLDSSAQRPLSVPAEPGRAAGAAVR